MLREPTMLMAALLLSVTSLSARAGAGPGDGCADCHGKNGASTEADVPSIGGVSAAYLDDQMALYRDSKRPCAETAYRAGDTKRPKTDMCKVAAKLSADETAAVSKELAGKPFVKAKQPFDAAKAAAGKKIHDTACEKCHSEGGSAADDDAGILAGLQMAYLKETFAQFSKGARAQTEKMKVKFNVLKPEEQEALLHYYASQQ